MKRVVIFILTLTIGFYFPIMVFAQINTAYSPSVQVDNTGGSYGGVRFQGVSASVLNCTNLTQKAAVAIGSFTDKLKGGFGKKNGPKTDQQQDQEYEDWYNKEFGFDSSSFSSVATDDKAAQKKLEEQKQELDKINKTNLCLNGLAYAVAKSMLVNVLDKTLRWATGGGIYGLALFVENPSAYINMLGQEQVNKFLQTQNNHPIFQQSIQSIILLSHTGVNDGRINQMINNNPVSTGYRNFQRNFTDGGWNSFLNMSYNPVGALFSASDKLSKNVNNSKQELNTQRIAGQGFTDVKTCVKWSSAKPASTVGPDGKPLKKVPSPYENSVTGQPTCLEWQTVTPGYVVAEQVSYATQSTQRQLEIADAYNEVLGAYFDQLLSNLFSKGLKGAVGGKGSIDASFGNDTYLGDLFGDGTRGTFGYVSTEQTGFYGEFNISKPQHTRTILQAQVDYLNASLDSYVAMRHIVPVLGALDYCIPGPNPTWKSGLGENYEAVLSSISEDPERATAIQMAQQFYNATKPWICIFCKDPEYDFYFYFQPTLYDKVTGGYTEDITPLTLKYTRENRPSDKSVLESLQSGFIAMVAYLETLYTTRNMNDAFATALPTATTTTLPFDSARIDEMLEETSKITDYNQTINELIPVYEESIGNTQYVIEELTAINKEVQQIVKIAKARYIQENITKGTPVKRSCLDKEYIINENPVVGAQRMESDAPDQMLLQSLRANAYFYDNL